MTIYDYLGINDDDLLNVEIPIKTILDNINNITLRWEAEELFDEIKDIKLKLSINRNEHYLQVLEINMKSAVNIERIAFIIQKTIKYRILFVFNYQDKNLLLWRSFKMTKSTDAASESAIPFVEARFTFSASFAPRERESSAFIPTPVPVATPIIRF